MVGKANIKNLLKAECVRILEERIEHASLAMLSAQEAANSEGKSSAGDKYETSRAMGQQDRDMNARQLEQARKDLAFIQALDVSHIPDSIKVGSLVYCKEGIFFIAAGLGSVNIGGKQIHIVSPAAPLANLLLNKRVGQKISMNERSFEILELG
ncbi:MAG: 3-oxoacyl-ACP synthase [Bacteroidetes bacterium]|nr:MAG: 3-oxoacyl-ACP synthase [Bacteroidota bacterium]